MVTKYIRTKFNSADAIKQRVIQIKTQFPTKYYICGRLACTVNSNKQKNKLQESFIRNDNLFFEVLCRALKLAGNFIYDTHHISHDGYKKPTFFLQNA